MINGIKFFEKIILVTVLIATVVAIGNEFMFMYSSQEVTLADLLLLFIYIEVVQMVREYWTLDRIRISIPLFIAITALARYIILQGKSGDPSFLLYEAGAILMIAIAVLILRMRKLKIFEDSGEE
ncbi:phosphate-starvation-inducible PsiE family protein [Pelagibacterales bacterium]|jgi:protein PsiE|nr:phosphate-starvation-inducible PsiE family protein [Pelagibacterales bacterium]MDA9980367.1 phosphate-starvation-inducible PsiE family protein [Pelagibacterales bacterium]MDB4220419.1 phosphate-starvation-inducible PsiE family protein [Pelagibacterales bacterium]MDB9817746.1 phosphate-starvation-inducible PsiE family protein [Pelagibacterales bacterium]MDB9955368.1 phosphate-starvation-inducible PsiE family protein [Pelagibacterales bacterium]|tara:strand:- start:960 stop:1334 length:375 start_codon:yes stop_codon:yes gene_type:complete